MAIDMIGPFDGGDFKVALDGYRVPHLTARPTNPERTLWIIVLDERLGLDLSEELLDQVVNFAADAMAIGYGYKSFVDACNHQGERHNPFGTRMMRIDTVEEL